MPGRFSEPIADITLTTSALEGCSAVCIARYFSKIGPSRRFLTFDPSAYSRPLCAFTLLCQNEFKSAISKRIRKCAPGCTVAPHGAELGTISQQFASPDTKGPSAHYTAPVDGSRGGISHCSSSGSSNSYSINGSRVTTDLQKSQDAAHLFNRSSRL